MPWGFNEGENRLWINRYDSKGQERNPKVIVSTRHRKIGRSAQDVFDITSFRCQLFRQGGLRRMDSGVLGEQRMAAVCDGSIIGVVGTVVNGSSRGVNNALSD